MTTYGSDAAAWFYVDGYQVAGVVTHLEDSEEAAAEDNGGLGENVGRVGFVGETSAEVQHDGFFDDAAASVIAALDPAGGGALGAQHTLLYAIAGNAIGRSCVLARGALEANFKKLVERSKFTKANCAYKVNTSLDTARVVLHRVARTSAGNSDATSVDNGAASANGGVAVLEVDALALGGYTNLAVTMRDSADNVTFAAIAGGSAFPLVTVVNTSAVLTIAGAIRRYASAAWAYGGAGSGPTWTGVVALVRNP